MSPSLFNSRFVTLGFFIVGFLAAAILIYLTPLKQINLVPPKVNWVKPAEFYADFKASPQKYYFLDIRPEFLRFEYPQDAVNKSLFALSEEAKNFPHDKKIVIFCEEGISSRVAYGFLQNQGFSNLAIVEGGRAAWKEAGLPLAQNANYNKEAEPFLYYFKEGGLLPK